MYELLSMIGPVAGRGFSFDVGLMLAFVLGWVPLVVGGAIAAGAAVGAGVQLAKGIGKNTTGSTAFQDRPGGYDPNASSFGGVQGGAAQYNESLQPKIAGVDARTAPQANYHFANQNYFQGQDARQGQAAASQMMLNRASGATPSIAGAQSAQDIGMLQQNAARQMQQGQAAQAAQSASARGPAGVALAQQQAANNTANMHGAIGSNAAQATQNISGQAQINAMTERMQAEQAAAGAYGQMRGGDLASQQQMAGQEQFQTNMQLQNRGMNDQRAMGYEGLGANAYTSEMNAQTQNQATLARSYDNAQTLNQQRRSENAKQDSKLWDKLIPSDMNAKQPLSLGAGGGDAYGSQPLAANSSGGGGGGQQSGGSIDPQQAMQAMQVASMFTSDSRAKAQAKGWDDATWRQNDPAGYAKAAVGEYNTALSPDEERAYLAWKQQVAPRDSGADYDFRGAYRAGISADPKTAHWPDTFKKPNHPTFSDESQYAVGENRARAGHWEGEQFTPAGRAHPQAGSADDQADINYIKYGPNADPAMLDDRAQGGPAQDGMGRAALDQQIGAQVQKEAPTAQWERSFGSEADARNQVRESDNRAEAAKIREGFAEKGGGQQPWWMTPMQEGMLSDDRAKLRQAYADGINNAQRTIDTGEAQPHPAYLGGGEQDREYTRGEKVLHAGGAAREFMAVTSPGWHATRAFGAAADAAASGARGRGEAIAGAARSAYDRLAPYASLAGKQIKRDFKNGPAAFSDAMAPGKGGGDQVAEANRSMAGSPYAYKPGLTPPEQKPGEPNFGPMAQNMERNPIAGTAVKEDPRTGLKMIDRDKALKVTMSGVADLQKQLDELKVGGNEYPTLQEYADQKFPTLGKGGKKK